MFHRLRVHYRCDAGAATNSRSASTTQRTRRQLEEGVWGERGGRRWPVGQVRAREATSPAGSPPQWRRSARTGWTDRTRTAAPWHTQQGGNEGTDARMTRARMRPQLDASLGAWSSLPDWTDPGGAVHSECRGPGRGPAHRRWSRPPSRRGAGAAGAASTAGGAISPCTQDSPVVATDRHRGYALMSAGVDTPRP
jgi:hypothetical protein